MQAWLNKLKIAIAEENVEDIGKLFEEKLEKGTADELNQAKALLIEALNLMEKKKDEVAQSIKKLKTIKEFFKEY